MKHLLIVFLLIIFCACTASAQVPEVRTRWFPVTGDSVLVEYAEPTHGRPVPAVLVLSDRFGMQENVRSVLKILAQMGFRAFAPPLHSAPLQAVEGIPDVVYDSTDITMITEIAVDIMNAASSNGKLGLLAFDAGAIVAIEMVARFPFFASAALFYPAGGSAVLARMRRAQAPLQLHIAQFDPVCTLDDVEDLRDPLITSGRRVNVYYYKEAHRFFFNPEHTAFHRKNTQSAWNRIMQLFRNTLR
jgi:dienelactone hydrolase